MGLGGGHVTLWSNFVVDIFSTTSADNRSQRVQFCCESHLRLCSFVSENLVDFSSADHDAKHIFVHHLKIVPSGSLLGGTWDILKFWSKGGILVKIFR